MISLAIEAVFSAFACAESFSGLKIVYLSDIHYGAFLKENRVRSLVERVNALQPDLIILGGDYGETSQGAVDFFALRPGFKAQYAVLGVMGNHDRTLPESNLEKLQQAMRENGVIPLVNDVWMLEKEGKNSH
jgi:predicted MPP superfamily phosphohydrolase